MMVRCAAFRRSWKHLASMQHCVKRAFRKATPLRSDPSNWSGRTDMTRARQRALIFAMIAIGLILAGLFGLRSLRAFREFRVHSPPPAISDDSQTTETDVGLIRDWMTIPFIAKMYKVPPPMLYKALGIPSQGNRDKSLKQLNEEYF